MLGIRMSMCQTINLQCSVCKRSVSNEERKNTADEAVLFGAAKYGICACGQEMSHENQTHGYKVRWTRWRNKLRRSAESIMEQPDVTHGIPKA